MGESNINKNTDPKDLFLQKNIKKTPKELRIIELSNKINSAEIKLSRDDDLSEDDKENLQWDIWDWEAEIRILEGGV